MLRTVLVGALLASATPAIACSTTDFNIEKFKVGAKNECTVTPCPVMVITGLLKNNCAQPAGAQVQITAYDGSGSVLSTSENWPASVKNIAPGRSKPFDLGWSIDYDPAIKRVDWEIVDVRSW